MSGKGGGGEGGLRAEGGGEVGGAGRGGGRETISNATPSPS